MLKIIWLPHSFICHQSQTRTAATTTAAAAAMSSGGIHKKEVHVEVMDVPIVEAGCRGRGDKGLEQFPRHHEHDNKSMKRKEVQRKGYYAPKELASTHS